MRLIVVAELDHCLSWTSEQTPSGNHDRLLNVHFVGVSRLNWPHTLVTLTSSPAICPLPAQAPLHPVKSPKILSSISRRSQVR
ncbi:hypothetical protein [Sphingobium sp. CR28]|uniref:hypothetical protein n=1 Tax=Sphingobium sp. CR28 TaxID=3400272 RepID=UPI003FEEE36A